MLFHVGALWRLNEIGWLRRLSFLGLQPVLQRCATILVSDGGGHISYKARVASDWARHLRRVLVVVDNQVRWLRKSNLIDEYRRGTFRGAYWGVRADMSLSLIHI